METLLPRVSCAVSPKFSLTSPLYLAHISPIFRRRRGGARAPALQLLAARGQGTRAAGVRRARCGDMGRCNRYIGEIGGDMGETYGGRGAGARRRTSCAVRAYPTPTPTPTPSPTPTRSPSPSPSPTPTPTPTPNQARVYPRRDRLRAHQGGRGPFPAYHPTASPRLTHPVIAMY